MVLLAESAQQAWQALGTRSANAGSKKVGRGISSNISGYGVPGNSASCAIEMRDDGRVFVSLGEGSASSTLYNAPESDLLHITSSSPDASIVLAA